MTGTLGRRGCLPASPSRVEGCIFGLLSGVDVHCTRPCPPAVEKLSVLR